MARTIEEMKAELIPASIRFTIADAEEKSLSAELRTLKCTKITCINNNYFDSCLRYHWMLDKDSEDQKANAKNLCANCIRASEVIAARIIAKKVLAKAKVDVIRLTRSMGKTLIRIQVEQDTGRTGWGAGSPLPTMK